jgi:hypothetical protein
VAQAGGAERGPPYRSCERLWRWLAAEWNVLDGRLTYHRGLDIASFGHRRLLNTAYAIRLDGRVSAELNAAETAAAERKRTLSDEEREQLAEDVQRRLDAELEAEAVGADLPRARRAQDNARAIQGLMEQFSLANESA